MPELSFELMAHSALATTVTAFAAVVTALLLHWLVTAMAGRFLAGHPNACAVLRKLRAPLRWLLPALALQAVWAAAPVDFPGLSMWRHGTLLAVIGAGTWGAVQALVGLRDAIMLHYPADMADNLVARSMLTQTTVLMRTLSGVVVLVGTAAALMTFPDVRQLGASLLASAGLAGLVVGFAAKPVLGNLIAGLQIAMAQPIRIDDVVIVEGEWGRVEEITGAFVVVRIWDERRLIVPLQWFIEHPFQNWTRTSAEILGTVVLWVDYRLPLAPVRRELERVCREAPEWDGRVCVLQVTDASASAVQLRALVSSADSGRNWDLRCRVREAMIAFLQREHPESLPRLRAEITAAVAVAPERAPDPSPGQPAP